MMHILAVLLTLIEVVVCLLLIGLVLIQRSKGEGISAAFGSGMGESLFGANVGNVVTRATVILGIVFLLNTICLTLLMSKTRSHGTGSVMDEMAKPPATAPALPGGPGTVATVPILPEPAASAPATATPATPAPTAPVPVAPAPVAPPAPANP